MDRIHKTEHINPLISVIVPVYNVEDYIGDCINSLQNQSYKNIEILLVDDGSSDKSLEICYEFAKEDERIRVFSKPNGGQGSARNLGLDKIRGEYVSFIDSDDLIGSDFIEKIYAILSQNSVKMAMSAYASFREKDEISNAKSQKTSIKILNDKEIFSEIFSGNEYFGTAVWRNLYHKSIFENLRFPEGQIYEDVAIAFEIFDSAKRVAISDEVLYFYRIRQGSTTNSFNEKHLQAVPSVEKFTNLVAKKYPDLKDEATFTLCDSMASVGLMILKSKASEFDTQIAHFRAFLLANYKLILEKKSKSKIKKFMMIMLALSPNLLKLAIRIYKALK